MTMTDTSSSTDSVMGDSLFDSLSGVSAKGNRLGNGKSAARIHKVTLKDTKDGTWEGKKVKGKYYSVEFKIANGDNEGMTLYGKPMTVTSPATDEKLASLMADKPELSLEEAVQKVQENGKTATKIGMETLKKLFYAAGYVDPKEATAADKAAIANGTMFELTRDTKVEDIEGRIVLITHKEGKPNAKGNTYQEVVKVEGAGNIGDIGSSSPI